MVAMMINGLESRAGAGPLNYPMAMEEGGCMRNSGVHIGVHRFGNKFLQFLLGDRIIPLENLHGPMPGSGHDTEEIISLEPPVIDAGMPEVMEGEILDPGLFAGHFKGTFDLGQGLSLQGEDTTINRLGQIVEHADNLRMERD